jgi:hypothetical protein
MSYHISILRTSGRQTIPITKDEVLGLSSTFQGWKYDADQNALVLPGENNQAVTLWFTDGELWTQNPNDETITAMLAIADHLGARLRGDEFETYRSVNETYFHPDDVEARLKTKVKTRTLLRQAKKSSWLFHILVFGGFILLIWLFEKLGLLD